MLSKILESPKALSPLPLINQDAALPKSSNPAPSVDFN